jgi:hypothetical protein
MGFDPASRCIERRHGAWRRSRLRARWDLGRRHQWKALQSSRAPMLCVNPERDGVVTEVAADGNGTRRSSSATVAPSLWGRTTCSRKSTATCWRRPGKQKKQGSEQLSTAERRLNGMQERGEGNVTTCTRS